MVEVVKWEVELLLRLVAAVVTEVAKMNGAFELQQRKHSRSL